MLSTAALVGAIVVGALVFSVALWCGICWAVSLRGGWPRLRELYACEPPAVPTTSFAGYVGGARYRGGALFGSGTPMGLYLNVLAPFRMGGAGPVLIPWSDITVSAPSASGMLVPLVPFEFPRAGTRLRVPQATADLLLAGRRGV